MTPDKISDSAVYAAAAILLLAIVAKLVAANMISRIKQDFTLIDHARKEVLGKLKQAQLAATSARGTQEFWSLSFGLGPETLIPRPDSEALVEAALELVPLPGDGVEVLDLGTGTGCLLLAVLSELPSARGTGIDMSEGAVAVARDNAAALGLASRCAFHVADWRDGPPAFARRTFDLVLCNPPYVPDGEIEALTPEVAKFEPRVALSGGADGLDPLRALMPVVAAALGPAGHFVVELGAGQRSEAAAIVCAAGLDVVGERNDLSGIARCLVAKVATVPRHPAENAWNPDFPTLR